MKSGGARPGAGRPKGVANKLTKEAIEKARSEGIMPLDYMLAVLRDPNAEEGRRDGMAQAAAPYLHPKLASVEQTIIDKTAEERLARLKELLG